MWKCNSPWCVLPVSFFLSLFSSLSLFFLLLPLISFENSGDKFKEIETLFHHVEWMRSDSWGNEERKTQLKYWCWNGSFLFFILLPWVFEPVKDGCKFVSWWWFWRWGESDRNWMRNYVFLRFFENTWAGWNRAISLNFVSVEAWEWIVQSGRTLPEDVPFG